MNAEDFDRRIRTVLIVGDFAEINGGQAKVAIESALLLAHAGLHVIFFAGSGVPDAMLRHPRIRAVSLGRHTLTSNPNRLDAMTAGLWSHSTLRALRREIAALDPSSSVIHCHGWAKVLSPSIGRALAESPVPTLYTMHEYFLACPNGGFFDYQKKEICTRRPLSVSCICTNCDVRHASHKAWRIARSALARSIGQMPRGLKHVAYISQTQLRAMNAYLPAEARRHALPNPIGNGGFPVNAQANEVYIFVGRLSPEKGGLLFAKAALIAGVKAMFVGDGPEAGAIRKANPDAIITGWVSPTEVQAHLSCARALIFPSLWYEGQPLAPIEALIRGVPVVCGSWSAASEVVDHGVNGVIYNSPDVESLANSLTQVASIPAFDARSLADEMSPERHLNRLLEIYEEMLSQDPT